MAHLLEWIKENYVELLSVVALFVAFMEGVTRLTPTKKDDAFLQRVGGWIKKVFDFLKIPNITKK